ncbi:MAG TPA: TIM barrel protein [Anaerolineaceae bacterium]|nr:TIM barrel protein [Anaerolineaceae bacterium]
MSKIQVGNAPCSWGTLEFEGYNVNPIGYKQMLDELVETGYTATELGDWGFMPSDPALLRFEIESRNLPMLGAFVQMAFKNPSALPAGKAEVMKVARLLEAAFPDQDPRPFIILADDNATVPVRTQNAGRITPEKSLTAEEWRIFTGAVQDVAREVREETGLPVLFHHHSAGYVETPEEIDCLLDATDPALVNLVFDTGHYVFGCGPDAPGSDGKIVPALEHYAERISYIHFKDCQPGLAARSRREGWDYIRALREGIFCELGQGSVDFPGVLAWLQQRNYDGFVLVEQDLLPGMGAPKESALRNREYLRSIGL